MQIGLIGLGKMGYNLALNLHKKIFKVVAYDISVETRKRISGEGISAVDSLKSLSEAFTGKK